MPASVVGAESQSDLAEEARARAAFERSRLPTHVRSCAGVAFTINTAFIGLDAFAYPEHLGLFLGIRLALNALFVAIWAAGAERLPRLSEYAIGGALGAAMLSMVYATGGPTSGYFAGLILVMVGIGVLLPLSGREAAALGVSLVVPYAAMPLFFQGPLDVADFTTRLVFVVSGALECVWSCTFLDSLRLQDFRRRRAIEQARDHLQEMDAVKSRFTANMHHELRTPLTLMMAPLDMMLGGDLGEISPQVRDYLQTLRSNSLRLLKLINNLLDLAKLESQQLEIKRRPLALEDRVRDVAISARPMVEKKGITLVEELEPVAEINADADALDKVLVNLLGNALKFTPAGGEIRFGLSPEADGVRIRVRDSGIGIPPDQLGRIFDRFAQVDTSATRKFEGTGIGLSLSKELVELHGGRIWAESEGEGHGTTMNVWLPRGEMDAPAEEEMLAGGVSSRLRQAVDALGAEVDVEAEPEAVPEPAAAGAPDAERLEEIARHVARHEDTHAEPGAAARAEDEDRPRIVLAEDNPDMRRLLSFLLEREFDLTVTRNGREALEAVRRDPPHLVVTDVMMPEMSGTELCQAIKGDASLASVGVMLVTSKAERDLKIEGLEIGADDYVTKPFHPRELMARARALTRTRVLAQQLEQRGDSLAAALEELRETQAQLVHGEKMASLGKFVSGIAHELNNPLNFVQGNLHFLRKYALTLLDAVARYEERLEAGGAGGTETVSEVRQSLRLDELTGDMQSLLEGCNEGITRSTTLVADLKNFSRMDRPDPSMADLHEGLRSTISVLRDRLRGIEVTLELGELPLVECIAGQINQVFMNLLSNAADATEEADGPAWIRVHTGMATPERVFVEVRDSGPGVGPEARERLFEPFFTTKEVGRGTGLGLSISYGVITRHGGSLTVNDVPGAGACFRVELPTRSAEERREVIAGNEPPCPAEE